MSAKDKISEKRTCCGGGAGKKQELPPSGEWFNAAATGNSRFVKHYLTDFCGQLGDEDGIPALIHAIAYNQPVVISLLKQGEVDVCSEEPVKMECYQRDYQITTVQVPQYTFPVHIAVYQQNMAALSLLVDELQKQGIYQPQNDNNGLNFIDLATAHNWNMLMPFVRQKMQFVLELIKEIDGSPDFNLLLIAIEFGNVKMTQLLIQLRQNDVTKQYVQALFDNYEKQKWAATAS